MPANTMTANTMIDNETVPRRGVGPRIEPPVDHAQEGETASVPEPTWAVLFEVVVAAVTGGNAPGFHQGGRISRRGRRWLGGSR